MTDDPRLADFRARILPGFVVTVPAVETTCRTCGATFETPAWIGIDSGYRGLGGSIIAMEIQDDRCERCHDRGGRS